MDVLVLFTVSITLNRIHRLAKSFLPYRNRGLLIGIAVGIELLTSLDYPVPVVDVRTVLFFQ